MQDNLAEVRRDGQEYRVIVVGAGLGGLCAALTFMKVRSRAGDTDRKWLHPEARLQCFSMIAYFCMLYSTLGRALSLAHADILELMTTRRLTSGLSPYSRRIMRSEASGRRTRTLGVHVTYRRTCTPCHSRRTWTGRAFTRNRQVRRAPDAVHLHRLIGHS